MDIPYPFLGKIGPKLAAAGFIRIAQGAYGGYALFRPAEEITLLDVVEAVEGIIFLNDCLMSENACHHRPTCAVHKVWHQARAGLREVLGSVHFAQLATEACAFESAGGSAEERE
jgi:Rrf2 family protein